MNKSASEQTHVRPKSTWNRPLKKPSTVKKSQYQSFQLDENKDPKQAAKAFQPWTKAKPVTPKHSDFLQLEVGQSNQKQNQ